MFTNIFAEDTIANSNYNSLQPMLEKRFSHGLQFQAAYTLSKSLDWASSFEETLNPFNFAQPLAFPVQLRANASCSTTTGNCLNRSTAGSRASCSTTGQISGITQFQSGFPIRLQTLE